MKTGYKVCDAMTRSPVFVTSKATIQECAKIMEAENVGSLLVKDGSQLKGIITDQDIVRKIIANGHDPKKTTVDKHMAKNLHTTTPDLDIFEALKIMTDKEVKQLPVMDGKKMIGLLTTKDVLKLEPELFELIHDNLEVKEEEHKPCFNEGICQECGNYSKNMFKHKDVLVCKNCR